MIFKSANVLLFANIQAKIFISTLLFLQLNKKQLPLRLALKA
jgi:hypothetical protein